ncbi:MAG: UDP-N-acetylmuramoyl-L-alanyl-D-glutamate--2,6-diaminopimelate ligase [Syntrophobacteraceae bacterium]|nr:UDP-N-acetylmuramoyl-L-alanyl-D-glutamate--2,6-diaminopimelate ligase [Syntrophobacteraceae bacterium]
MNRNGMGKTLSCLLKGLDVLEAEGKEGIFIEGLSYDSRRVGKGDLFVALRGTRLDGRAFIRDAVQRGARAVVAESAPENGFTVPWVRVADSRKALAHLATNFFEDPSRDLTLIGVTGTNGKTTTTLLLEGILRRMGHFVGVVGTLGYCWVGVRKTAAMTTPESLDLQRLFHEMRVDGVTHVVMEVSSHALAMGRVEGCSFKGAVFTNLSQDHLDFHGDMEKYFAAKSLLFSRFLGSPGGERGTAVVNLDDHFGKRLAESIRGEVWTYSLHNSKARVRVQEADFGTGGIRAKLAVPGGIMRVESPLLGRLNLYNVVAAASTALSLGIPPEAVPDGLAAIHAVDGRLQRVPVPEEFGFQVVVDYAHTPDAMDKALGCLREMMTCGRLLAVFGCGGDRDRGKRPLMGGTAARWADLVVVTSDNPRSEDPEGIIREIEPGVYAEGMPYLEPDRESLPARGYSVVPDRREAIELALSWARPGDVVFIGGKGHETYQIMGNNVLPFDDKVVVREFLAAHRPAS